MFAQKLFLSPFLVNRRKNFDYLFSQIFMTVLNHSNKNLKILMTLLLVIRKQFSGIHTEISIYL